MDLRLLIILLFIALVISLSSSFFFLVKDVQANKKRSLYALGIRLTIAGSLMSVIFYGLYTGELGSSAPWDRQLTKEQVSELHSESELK